MLLAQDRFSALQRAEIAEIQRQRHTASADRAVSVLFNEPKLLKWYTTWSPSSISACFSALQRAEIAEIAAGRRGGGSVGSGFSALQRAEIAEISSLFQTLYPRLEGFSALQRAEIAEIATTRGRSQN